MERKLGLYVTLGNDGSLKRTLVSISGETELEATTLNDEVILFSELIFDFYAFIVDRIRLSAAYLVTQDGDGKDTVDICNKVISEIDILCFIVLAAGSKKLGSIRPHDIFEYRWIITRHRCTTVATDGEAFISNAFVEHDDPLIWPNRHSGVGISLNSYNIVSIRQCGIKGLLRCGILFA